MNSYEIRKLALLEAALRKCAGELHNYHTIAGDEALDDAHYALQYSIEQHSTLASIFGAKKDPEMFDTRAVRALANQDYLNPYWADQMKQALLWACDIIDAANRALEPQKSIPQKGIEDG
jgi:hypothetical protein